MRERRRCPELEPPVYKVVKHCVRCGKEGPGKSFKRTEPGEVVKVRGCTHCADQTAAELKKLTVRPKRDNPAWTQR